MLHIRRQVADQRQIGGLAVYQDISCSSGASGGDPMGERIEKSGLAGAAGSHDGQHLARADKPEALGKDGQRCAGCPVFDLNLQVFPRRRRNRIVCQMGFLRVIHL